MPPPILTITLNPAIDLNLVVPRDGEEEILRAEAVSRAAGGKGINVSRVLVELGLRSTAACVVGGPDAQVFLSLLEGARFEVVPLEVKQPMRTNVTIATRGGGRSATARKISPILKVNQPGPRVTTAEWRRLRGELAALMRGREWVVLAGALPPGAPATAYRELTELAHRNGAKVAIDCVGPALIAALASRPDLVKPNRAELALTVGMPCATRGQTVAAARRLQARGAGIVVVTHAAAECLALHETAQSWKKHEGESEHSNAPIFARPPRIRFAGPVGSGDSLLAGLLAGLAKGRPLEEALRLGLACGSATASLPDPQLATRGLINRLLAEKSGR